MVGRTGVRTSSFSRSSSRKDEKGWKVAFNDFCNAFYPPRKAPITSQAKFARAAFEAAGCEYPISVNYWTALFRGDQQLSEPMRDSFPEPIDKEGLYSFLYDYCNPKPRQHGSLKDRCALVARNAGLSSSRAVDPQPFLRASTDWFEAIIHDPENCDVLERSYLLRLKGEELKTSDQLPVPLYSGDRVDVLNPPVLQEHSVGFWQEFTHQWVFQNIGEIPWIGRTLVCINPHDSYIRSINIEPIVIPDTDPGNNRIKVQCAFKVQGYEGRVTSQWELQNENGENCFPGRNTQFNVAADVTFPHSRGKK